MYQSLLLTAGGGIISNVQKALQDDAPVVVIGVGGTGAKALDTLKKKVYRQLQPDNPGDAVPKYEHIRFLEIDSDEEWVANTNLYNDQEFENLQDHQVKTKFTNPVTLADMMKKPQFQWLEAEDIRVPDSLHGAGGIRQLGRYMIVNSSQSVYMKIKNNISNAVAERETSDLVIHIMAGVSGGMGSGCFLDACYIVRKVLEDMSAGAATVFGYFFLPDVITTIPEVAADEHKISANYRNGYAAMAELDYLMNLKANHGRFVQNYGSFTVNTDQPPVDLCHLISALDANGNSRRDGFKYCMNVAADYVMSYLSKAVGADAITPKGSLANINTYMDRLAVTKGAYNRYNLIGASSAEMPMRQVATYLATGLYRKMGQYLKKNPVDQDVVDFAEKTMQLTIPELKRRLQKKVELSREVPRPAIAIPKAITASHVHSEAILKPMEDWLAQQIGTVEKNYQGLNADVPEYKRNPDAEALIGILYNHLEDMALDSKYGPYYAIAMLNRVGKDLDKVLQGLHVEADQLVKQAVHQRDFQSEQVEEAKQAFTSSKNTLLNRKIEDDAYDAYRGQIGIWYRRKLDAEMYRYLDKMILGLQKKANEMYRVFFGKLQTLLDELEETFHENAVYFDGGHGDDPSDDGFTICIMKFSEVQPHLDSVLQAEKPDDAMTSMIRYFLDHSGDWLSGEEYRISRMVNDFMYGRFTAELKKGMQNYIEDKYPGMTPEQREEQLKTSLFQPLMSASEPLFWRSAAVDLANTAPSINLTYPTVSSDIKAAVKEFKEVHPETALRGSELQDRTFMLRLYSGMPLFGYHGLELMKQRYDSSPKEGLHLYGKGSENWKKLPTPIPYSLNPGEVYKGDEIAAAYQRAKEIGILKITRAVSDDPASKITEFVLKKPVIGDKVVVELLEALRCIGEKKEKDDSKLDDLVFAAVKETYLMEDQEFSDARLDDWITRIRQLKNDIVFGKYEEYTVAHYQSETVALDNIIHSPVMTKILLESVELYEAAELGQNRLENLRKDTDGENQMLRDFANALFTGVLQQGIGKIYYTYVERHTEREAVLASKSMPFAGFMHYQAYVSFKELEEDIRNDIVSQAKERINNLQEGDDAIALKISQKYTPRDMADMEKQYSKLKEKNEIRDFYNKFLDLLYDYTDQFR